VGMRDWILLIVDGKITIAINFADHNNTCSKKEREREREKER